MKRFVYILSLLLITACEESVGPDAQGTFEATEVLVSSEASGKIMRLDAEEGTQVLANAVVGEIDSLQLDLQRKQLIAQRSALLGSRPDVQKQVATIKEQITKQKTELARFANMLRDGATTQKQYDDMEAHLRVLESQLDATLSTLTKNTVTINNNSAALEAQILALEDRIAKCRVVSPVGGTVLVKYAEVGELATMGKPLFKVADLDKMYLRAYFTSEQLSKVKLGDTVKVIADFGAEERFEYEGTITWIASESEFTPKTIQTKDSRANLVYSVKIAVKNDGRLKIGLAGEVIL
jgi:HlyD family secretion protein